MLEASSLRFNMLSSQYSYVFLPHHIQLHGCRLFYLAQCGLLPDKYEKEKGARGLIVYAVYD